MLNKNAYQNSQHIQVTQQWYNLRWLYVINYLSYFLLLDPYYFIFFAVLSSYENSRFNSFFLLQ